MSDKPCCCRTIPDGSVKISTQSVDLFVPIEKLIVLDRLLEQNEREWAWQMAQMAHSKGGRGECYAIAEAVVKCYGFVRAQLASAMRITVCTPVGGMKRLREQVEHLLLHCKDSECSTCAEIICPGQDPLHFHHDGCPICDAHEQARQDALIPIDDKYDLNGNE